MVKLGIAGKIGSGKSVIAGYLKELGWHVVQADELGHRLLREREIKEELARFFGIRVFGNDGEVERNQLLSAALGQEDGMDFINALLWPRIAALLPGELGSSGAPVVLEAAILLQAGWDAFLDKVILVRAAAELRSQRLVERHGKSPAALRQLMELQDDYEQIEEGADYVLDNLGSQEDLLSRVRQIPEIKACLN
jgi:dephospho-CoA kinase